MSLGRALRVRSRPLRHTLAFLGLRGLVALLRRLPLNLSLSLGAGFGRVCGFIDRRGSAHTRRNLARLEDAPSPGSCWADLGRRAAEFANARRMLERVDLVDPVPTEWPRGVVVATLHLGNWELLGAALAAEGLPVHSAAAAPKASPLHRWLDEERRALGVHTHPPGGGARAARSILAEGGGFALFVDQATRERGRPVPFFGEAAHTPETVERLLALSCAELRLAWSRRDAEGRHRVHFEAIEPTLEALTARAEALIRQHPEQWVWLHPRWPQ